MLIVNARSNYTYISVWIGEALEIISLLKYDEQRYS